MSTPSITDVFVSGFTKKTDFDTAIENLQEEIDSLGGNSITQSITSGDTTHSPSGDAIFNANAGLETQINANAAAISSESTARSGGDASNASAIAAESSARISADSAEATARANGDTALQSQITTNATAISNEATTRGNADTANAAAISAEVTARTNADLLKEDKANKNQPNGYAGLDSGGRIPSNLLPAGIDEIIEYANLAAFPATGSAGIIYLAQDTNKEYRWSGSSYIPITNGFIASTDNVPEGSTNLYYTQLRFDSSFAAKSTTNLSEGTNLYYTQGRFNSAFAAKTTDNLSEGSTNLYFTVARVLATLLTGFAASASRTAIAATDSILIAFGKIQKYLNDLQPPAFANFGTTTGTVADGGTLATETTNRSAADTTLQANITAGDLLALQKSAVLGYDIMAFRKVGTAVYEGWYSANSIPFTPTTLGFPKDSIKAIPVVFSRAQTLDRIGIEISTAGSAGSVLRLAIYDDVGGVPTNLIIDAGTVAGDATGNMLITINKAIVPGLYYLCMNHNSTTSIVVKCIPSTFVPNVFGAPAGATTTTSGSGISSTFTYAAFPTTFPVTTFSINLTIVPYIKVRLSA